jgi:hypothetical protein
MIAFVILFIIIQVKREYTKQVCLLATQACDTVNIPKYTQQIDYHNNNKKEHLFSGSDGSIRLGDGRSWGAFGFDAARHGHEAIFENLPLPLRGHLVAHVL